MTFDAGTWVLYLAATVIIVRYMIIAPAVVIIRFIRGWMRVRSR